MVDQVAEINGTARVIAGEDATFEGVRYRIAVTEQDGRTQPFFPPIKKGG
jgi:hypothetical protein